jgi:hypothetical protein
MEALRRKNPHENVIRDAIAAYLRQRFWMVRVIHATEFMSGLPDLWAAHAEYGTRWIEVKKTAGYRLTPAQRLTFPEMESKRIPVFILTAATDVEYLKLFDRAIIERCGNWRDYR